MQPGRAPAVAPLALLAAAAAVAATVVVAAAVPAAAARADEAERLPCTGLDHLAGFLADAYGERPVSAGLQANGQFLQIFASGSGGTWTAVTTSPAGLACVVATGRDWEQATTGGGGPDQVYNPAALAR